MQEGDGGGRRMVEGEDAGAEKQSEAWACKWLSVDL